MTDYENNEAANKRAEGWRKYVVWGFVPAAVGGLWLWFAVVKPIICGITAGCGSASW